MGAYAGPLHGVVVLGEGDIAISQVTSRVDGLMGVVFMGPCPPDDTRTFNELIRQSPMTVAFKVINRKGYLSLLGAVKRLGERTGFDRDLGAEEVE